MERRVLVQVDDLAFGYERGSFELRVPRFSVDRGEAVALIGPSGSGKTTLLHLIAGIVTPRSGKILVDGVEVSALAEGERRRNRITRMGLVFQEFELLDHLTVLDNALLPYRITGALRLDRPTVARAREIAEELGLADKIDRRPRQLSHGERQRVGIARALLHAPVLLLADEPTGNLDPRTKERVIDLLLEQARRRETTLLTVTHDHGLLDRFDRVVDVVSFAESATGAAS